MMGFIFAEPLHYLLHEVEGEKVAHCLNLDLVAAGKTKDEAISRLNEIVRVQVGYALKNGALEILRTKAPARYWEMFNDAGTMKSYKLELHRDLSPVSVKECHLTYLLAEAA
jgi:hypothetical protein